MTAQSQAGAYIADLAALSEAIRQLGTVPSGHLYARVMGHVDIHAYERALGILRRAGLVEMNGDLIRWIGPHIADAENVGEEFVECERCHVDTPESNTIVIGMLGDVRVCRECAEDES